MNTIVDPTSGEEMSCRAVAHGLARPGFAYAMDLAGGSYVAEGADERLLAACKASNRLSIEALITPAGASQAGPARIVTFSSGTDSRDFTLGQEGDRLILRLRTTETGPNGVDPQVDLGTLEAGVPQHVIVTYEPGRLVCYRDGRPSLDTDQIRGDLRSWEAKHLLFGDEWGGGRDWAGTLEGVAILDRVVRPEEARRRHELATRRLEGRRPPERLEVRAKLVALSPTPPPNLISPYHRVLIVNTYQIEEVLRGKEPADATILVAEWAILDRMVLPGPRQKGKRYRLALEKFEEHHELEPEKQIMETDQFDLPLYYDVRPDPSPRRDRINRFTQGDLRGIKSDV